MLAVTSFGPTGYQKYAREGLETFVAHWPGQIVAYYEHERPELTGTLVNATGTGKLRWVNLFDDVALKNVLGWMIRLPQTQGKMPDGYSFHHDAFKFCRKTFAVRNAAAGYSGPLFWLDADLRFHEDVPKEVLEDMMKPAGIAYLGRVEADTSECGFIGFETSKEDVQHFIRRWAGAYVDGSFLELRGWHDCWVFDELLKQSKIPATNLTELVSVGGVAERVFEKSVMGQYGRHLKGSVKFSAAKPEAA